MRDREIKREARFLHVKCAKSICTILVSRGLTIDNAVILPRESLCSRIMEFSFINQVRYVCEENDENCYLDVPVVRCNDIIVENERLIVINVFAKRVAVKAEVVVHGEVLP
ncbi:MAG: hypothetical protein F7B60_07325 [Desulfurococcales archaeon]|nr:hypothetical protein [Desulfurococcales archaeon]